MLSPVHLHLSFWTELQVRVPRAYRFWVFTIELLDRLLAVPETSPRLIPGIHSLLGVKKLHTRHHSWESNRGLLAVSVLITELWGTTTHPRRRDICLDGRYGPSAGACGGVNMLCTS